MVAFFGAGTRSSDANEALGRVFQEVELLTTGVSKMNALKGGDYARALRSLTDITSTSDKPTLSKNSLPSDPPEASSTSYKI